MRAQANHVNALRALLAVILLLNGTAMPAAAAIHAAAGAARHASHDQPGHAPGSAPGHHSSGAVGGDCCDGMGCDCGCAVSQAATPPVALPRTAWRAALPEFAFIVKSFDSSPLAAPFRPPA
jgi:hypothetical protein